VVTTIEQAISPIDCQEAVQTMEDYIHVAKPAPVEQSGLEDAVEHVKGCTRCLTNPATSALLDRVIQASLCLTGTARLPALIDSELSGAVEDEEMASVRAHLSSCPNCREQYEMVKDMVLAEARGLLGTSRKASAPLWEALSAKARAALQTVLDTGVETVKQLTMPIEARLAKGKAVITTTSPVLRPLRLMPALAMRHKTAVPEEAAHLIPLPDEESSLQVNVTLRATDRGPAQVAVEVVNLQRAAPIEGAQVILFERTEGGERILQALDTDELGQVDFALNPGQYVIQVRHARRVLRFPLGFEHNP